VRDATAKFKYRCGKQHNAPALCEDCWDQRKKPSFDLIQFILPSPPSADQRAAARKCLGTLDVIHHGRLSKRTRFVEKRKTNLGLKRRNSPLYSHSM
jgi:hypothetical protein